MDNLKNNKIFISLMIIALIGLLVAFYAIVSTRSGSLVPVKVFEKSKEATAESAANEMQARTEAEKIDSLKSDNSEAVKEAAKASFSQVRGIDATDHILGVLNAPVKIITYSDFDCSFCTDFNDTLKRISLEFKDQVVIAYRHLPQRQHANSWPAAEASECAAEQGKFWEMHDGLFALKKEERLDESGYAKIAQDLKLDQIKFLECVAKNRYKDKILAQYGEAKSFGVIGTPGTFVNGKVFPGAVPFEDFVDSSGLKREGMRSVVEGMLK